MDRKKFEEQFNRVLEEGAYLRKDNVRKIQNRFLYRHSDKEIEVIAIEEMAELTKELTKHLRGEIKDDDIGIYEEFVDVETCLYYLKDILNLDEEKLKAARTVKLLREEERLNVHDFVKK